MKVRKHPPRFILWQALFLENEEYFLSEFVNSPLCSPFPGRGQILFLGDQAQSPRVLPRRLRAPHQVGRQRREEPLEEARLLRRLLPGGALLLLRQEGPGAVPEEGDLMLIYACEGHAWFPQIKRNVKLNSF